MTFQTDYGDCCPYIVQYTQYTIHPYSRLTLLVNARSGCDGARHALAKPTAGGLAAGEQSDHLVYAEAYDRWSKAVSEAEAAGGRNAGKDVSRRHAAKHGLSGETLAQIAEMRGQYASLLWDAGLLRTGGSTGTNNMHEHVGKQGNKIGRASSAPRGWVDDVSAGWNADSRTPKVVKAVIAAGLYANVAAIDFDDASSSPFGKKENATTSRWKDIKGEIGIHSASVNAKLGGFVSLSSGSANATSMTGSPLSPFLTFHEKIKTHRVFVRDCTILPPTALLLFCGGDIDVKHELGLVCLDGWLWLKASAQTAAVSISHLPHSATDCPYETDISFFTIRCSVACARRLIWRLSGESRTRTGGSEDS